MQNHYYTPEGYYTYSLPASPDTSPPSNATRTDLPEMELGKWPKWENGSWVMVQDLRGTEFWYQDGVSDTISELGSSLPPGTLTSPPPTDNHTGHNGSEWLLDKTRLIETVKENRKKILNDGFQVEDVLFDSDYNARIAYQEIGNVFAMNPDYSVPWKANGTTWVILDAALYEKVMSAGQQHIADCFVWEQAKTEEINAAQNQADLATISLEYGT